MSFLCKKNYFTLLSNFPLIEFPLSPNTWIWCNHSICGSDIPHINPGTGFPSGPRIPCRAPGTVKRRRVSVLQRASHIKEPPLERWCFLCLTGTSLSRCMFATTSYTFFSVTHALHAFKEHKQSSTKANTEHRGCPLQADRHALELCLEILWCLSFAWCEPWQIPSSRYYPPYALILPLLLLMSGLETLGHWTPFSLPRWTEGTYNLINRYTRFYVLGIPFL